MENTPQEILDFAGSLPALSKASWWELCASVSLAWISEPALVASEAGVTQQESSLGTFFNFQYAIERQSLAMHPSTQGRSFHTVEVLDFGPVRAWGVVNVARAASLSH